MVEGLYVYCVIGTGEARNLGPFGIGGRGDVVTTLSYRDLSAVVSNIPMDKYVVGRDALLCHEKVLEKVMAEYPLLQVLLYTIGPYAVEFRCLLR
ncbi:MAG: GvpL/GvpF family gas vesicle protein [Chloroflexi bacterium]|nr:GvpL/GvpF family gas vesicle protein [Chloroflexota bacterium]